MARDFHPLRVAAVERLCDDAVAVTFDVPAELAARFAFRPGQSLTVRRCATSAAPTRSARRPARAPRIGVREVPGGLVSSGWCTTCVPATWSRSRRRAVPSPPIWTPPGGTC